MTKHEWPRKPDENPYRSPEIVEDAADGEGAWRWADVLVMRRKGAVLPAACVRSNQKGAVGIQRVGAMSLTAWFSVWLLLQIPAIGFFVGVLGVLSLTAIGRYVEIELPLRQPVAAIQQAASVVMCFMIVGGNMVSAVALTASAYGWSAFGFALSLAGALIDWVSDRRYFSAEPIGQDFVAIRGVHPDYLARLPEFPGARGEPFSPHGL